MGCMTDPMLNLYWLTNQSNPCPLPTWALSRCSAVGFQSYTQSDKATLTCVLPVLPEGFGQSGSEGLRRCRPSPQPGQAEAPCRGRPHLCPPRAGASRLAGGSFDGAVVFRFFLSSLPRPSSLPDGCSSLTSGLVGVFGTGRTGLAGRRLSLRRRR